MTRRQTVVGHRNFAANQSRLEAAQSGNHGVQVTNVVGLAARLIGGSPRGFVARDIEVVSHRRNCEPTPRFGPEPIAL